MEEKSKTEAVVREIRRKTRRKYSAEEKIRIVLEGLRGEESIAVTSPEIEGREPQLPEVEDDERFEEPEVL